MTINFRMPSVLRKNLLLLRYTGLWPDDTKYFKKNNYTYFSLSLLLLFLFPDYLLVSFSIFSCDGDMERISTNLTYTAQRTITMVQLIFFLRKLATAKAIIEQLNMDLIQPKTVEDKTVIMNSLKTYFFITNSYFSFCTITTCFYILLPVLEGERRYPFDILQPLQDLASPWYEIIYIHQVIAIWINHSIHTGIDMLCAGLMAAIGSQCDFLRAKLMNFQPSLKTSEEGVYGIGGGDDYEIYFRDIIAHHREILLFFSMSKRVNVLFSQLVFGEISLVIILLCTSLFRLSVIVELSECLLTAAFVFAMSLQLFLYCWFGAEVHSKSEILHSGSFHCDWVGSPHSFQKTLMFFMHKTATPIKIYALHFFELSTVTFASIMRSSWSFFVLLQQMNTIEENSP